MKSIIMCLYVLILLGCRNTEKDYKNASIPVAEKEQQHPGKKFMKVHCYICHDATTQENDRVAPPMIAIKRRYMMEGDTKQKFIDNIRSFVKTPTKDKAIMYGAVKKFGVMSKMTYPDAVIEKIADYMYDNELETPAWFEEHYQKNHKKPK